MFRLEDFEDTYVQSRNWIIPITDSKILILKSFVKIFLMDQGLGFSCQKSSSNFSFSLAPFSHVLQETGGTGCSVIDVCTGNVKKLLVMIPLEWATARTSVLQNIKEKLTRMKAVRILNLVRKNGGEFWNRLGRKAHNCVPELVEGSVTIDQKSLNAEPMKMAA